MTNSRQITNICGKVITLYQSKGNKQYSSEDIGRYLQKFKLAEALRLIGSVSSQLFKSPNSTIDVSLPHEALILNKSHVLFECCVPLYQGLLAYLAMRLIENANDDCSKDMALEDLAKAADMYCGLSGPVKEDNNIIGCLIRFSLVQSEYQRITRDAIARTLILYSEDFWKKNSKNKSMNIDQIILSATGLTLQEILVYSFCFTGACIDNNRGFFRITNDEAILQQNKKEIKILSLEGQKKYVKWLSTNYSDFRKQMNINLPISSTFEKFRFNPLIKTPIIIPDRNVAPEHSQTYIVPIPQLIHSRSTRGLYFDCSDYCRLKYHDQRFRNAFGYVFQEYVGLLLREALKTTGIKIKSEWSYGTKQHSKHTPDWILIRDKTAILIEVKQSCLYLEAKQWGNEEEIRKNINATIGKGVKQLWKFEQDIRSGNYEKLEKLKDIERFDKLIIIYDKTDYINSFIRDVIKEMYSDIPQDYNCQIIDIEDFEYMIGTLQDKIFEILAQKQTNMQYDTMDFGEYLFYSNSFGDREPCNPFLDSIAEQFWHEMGLPDLD